VLRIVPRPDPGAASERCLRPLERRPYVVVGDDPVALEDADRLVASDAHRQRLVDASRHQVPDG
jgi:hypothetical protein